jgi:hypothetical protein
MSAACIIIFHGLALPHHGPNPLAELRRLVALKDVQVRHVGEAPNVVVEQKSDLKWNVSDQLQKILNL